ncbi:MAG: polysaccharide biosynthesis C-terminal domain-containing protein [Bacteroidia bacterium]|nr:polysaccharide biosynthesis C-terminal domain-containing protein [Bacteroidia bacterium]MBP8668798.1 polysaccharide biosynthesis C-terminal domain-containing protein [Bacteroidia bacterium]
MGVIQRQGLKNTITTYLGIAIGFVSLIVIQPQFLTKEELGLTRILYSFSILVAMFVPLGIGNATTKYFPLFKDSNKNHHGYFAFMMLFPLAGFVLAAAILFAIKNFIIAQYISESPMFTEFYYYVFPLTFILSLITCLNVYCYANYKSTIPAFLNDVVARVLVIVVITVYFLKWITLNQFISCYVGLYGIQLLMLLAYIFVFDKPVFKIDWKYFREKDFKTLIRYGLLLWFAGVASIGLKYLDSIMLGKYLPLSFVGIYTIAAFIPTVIEAPLTALEKIAASRIAFAWAENNIKDILEIYRKSSLYMLALGGLLFTGININIENLLSFLPDGYQQGATVVFIISLGTLVNMLTGANAPILFNSDKYRWGAFFLIALALVSVALQMVFIPWLGLNGAAIATVSCYVLYNLFMSAVVWKFYNLHPFDKKMLIILFAIIFCFAINYFLPAIENKILDMIHRSVIVTVVYLLLIYRYKVLEEFHHLLPWKRKN